MMRFHVGSIPDEFTPDETWRAIREPNPYGLQLLAVPVGIGVALLVAFCWSRLGVEPSITVPNEAALFFLAGIVLSFPALIAVHELLHAFAQPRFGFSKATVLGVWPSRLLFYATYAGPLSRDRFLFVIIVPFLVITVLPLLIAATGVLSKSMMMVAAWFSIWNALFSCGDLIGLFLIWTQIPRAAIVQNQSWRTYWKQRENGAESIGADETHVSLR